MAKFPISRDPPEGGTNCSNVANILATRRFPISRDPPEGGTLHNDRDRRFHNKFPISRDPPEGGTV